MSKAVQEIEERGYTILEGVIEPDPVDEIDRVLLKLERDRGIVPTASDWTTAPIRKPATRRSRPRWSAAAFSSGTGACGTAEEPTEATRAAPVSR